MGHMLPELPYEMSALEPGISAETLEFHYGKHHRAYVDKLNGMIAGTEFETASLEDIISKAPAGGIFNNAAQVWNHSFYWRCLTPGESVGPAGTLASAIDRDFGSLSALKDKFLQMAVGNFGSGWTWLVKKSDGSLDIVNTSNAGNPLRDGMLPLLTCDVWEHAYYIDYRNARPKYLDAFWGMVDWKFVAGRFEA